MRLTLIAAAVAVAWMSCGADAQGDGLMEQVLQKLRIFNKPKPIGLFARLCKNRMNDFGRCIAGQNRYVPRHPIGNGFVRKVRKMIKRMRKHPNVKEIVRVTDDAETCFDSCVASPQTTIDCLLDAAINGQPWQDVTQCMKNNFRTGNLDLSVPDLGNLDKTKEDLRMFMSVALYRFWDVKGKSAFWDKFRAQLRIICPNRAKEVRQCVNDKVKALPKNLNVGIKHITGRYKGNGFSKGGDPPVGKLTLFGDEPTRDFITKRMFLLTTAGCSFHFVDPRIKGLGALNSKEDCAFAAIPKCFHYMWTLKDGICNCRTRTTSNPNLDPFEPNQLTDYITQAQTDYIAGTADPNWKCHLKGKEASKCPKCRALGTAMDAAFTKKPSLKTSFAESFKDEIEIVIDMLRDLCEIGSGDDGGQIVYDNNRTCRSWAADFNAKAKGGPRRRWRG